MIRTQLRSSDPKAKTRLDRDRARTFRGGRETRKVLYESRKAHISKNTWSAVLSDRGSVSMKTEI